MEKKQSNKQIPFEKVIEALLDNQKPFPAVFLHQFSDISDTNLKALEKVWTQILPERRANLLKDLCEIQDADTLVCFDEIGKLALLDKEAPVRLGGIDLLWDAPDTQLLPRLVLMLRTDEEEAVRAAAGSALGAYILKGELEELETGILKQIEDTLLDVLQGSEKDLVKRRCMEALGFSSREEIKDIIQAAFSRNETAWKASALFAMGRSANPYWKKNVLGSIRSVEPDVQLEAIRAAGELELEEARKPLLAMIPRFEEMDVDMLQAVIWSLSQIGGERVSETLEKLLEVAEDDEMEEFIQDALDNLEFNDSLNDLEMIEIDFPDEDGLTVEDLMDVDEDDVSDSSNWWNRFSENEDEGEEEEE